MIKVLVTGARGFVGKKLLNALLNRADVDVFTFQHSESDEKLIELLNKADIVYHLAGVNRPEKVEEFFLGNTEFTDKIVLILEKLGKTPHIVMSSSRQAVLDNPYGKSKLASEEALIGFSKRTASSVAIYRLTNVFGGDCRPNYNSVVATFCYNIINELAIQIRDEQYELELVYVEDVVNQFLEHLNLNLKGLNYIESKVTYKITLGELASTLMEFKNSLDESKTEKIADGLNKNLYDTFKAYRNYKL